MGAITRSIISHGMLGHVVDIECQITNGLPSVTIVGSASKSTDEARERVRTAYSNSGQIFPRKRIVINLAPADIPKTGTSLDLSIAIAIMVADKKLKADNIKNLIFIGELGLNGFIRPVRGIIGIILASKKLGNFTFVIPNDNLDQALVIPSINILPVKDLQELYAHLADIKKVPIKKSSSKLIPKKTNDVNKKSTATIDIKDIAGQFQAKRALEIVAAGGHNILLYGPPGTGKSMLSKALVGILPPLSEEEILEVSHLHSLSISDYDAVIAERPFRAPHHSASMNAITGGGQHPRPGEISLSHRGVLLLDEFTEFSQQSIESLRQPLEDRTVTITRIKTSIKFPADFILIATANPCPCGFYGTDQLCECSPRQIANYAKKLSGPILDRIDLFVYVGKIDHSDLLKHSGSQESSSSIYERIKKARDIQKIRYKSKIKLNNIMSNTEVKQLAKLEKSSVDMLNTAARQLNLSPRAYMRTVKVARTIADIEQSESILIPHIAEALQYRYRRTT